MITVLTPSFNRAHTLPRVYASLLEQTDRRFEWLIIDDGSTDNTGTWVQDIIDQADFKIRYVPQQNGGKHVAINTGAVMAETDWILILDSDDALTPDAIATVVRGLSEHSHQQLAGLCFRKGYFDGKIIGQTRAIAPELLMHPTAAGKLLQGDLAYIFRRSALLSHPFPVIKGEKFVPELYIWNKIGDDGPILFFTQKSIYLCEYLDDGYSKNFLRNLKRNPRGFLLYYRAQFFREKIGIHKLKCAIRSMQCCYYAVAKRSKK